MDLIGDQYLLYPPLGKASSQEVHPHEMLVRGYKRPVIRLKNWWNLAYSMVVTAHNTDCYLNIAKSTALAFSAQTNRSSGTGGRGRSFCSVQSPCAPCTYSIHVSYLSLKRGRGGGTLKNNNNKKQNQLGHTLKAAKPFRAPRSRMLRKVPTHRRRVSNVKVRDQF